MKKRKIVQLHVVPATEDQMSILYALCDDGTLWAKQHPHREKSKWFVQNIDRVCDTILE